MTPRPLDQDLPIATARLLLRAFTEDDVPAVTQLAGERDIAATTCRVPHPYREDDACSWILSHPNAIRAGTGIPLAITSRETGRLVGAIGLDIGAGCELESQAHRAELGYWIGKPLWGRGYATEAAAAVLMFGFESLMLDRIFAMHFATNLASGKVLEKIGMKPEGTLRQHQVKWGIAHDVVRYAILKHEFRSLATDRGHA